MDHNKTLGEIENFLAFMELADMDVKSMKGASMEHRFPLAVFKDAEPLVTGDEFVMTDRLYDRREQNPMKMGGPIDLALLLPGKDSGDAFCIRRLRSMAMQETRGKIKPWTPNAVEEQAAIVGEGGTYQGAQTIWGWVGHRWQIVKAGGSVASSLARKDMGDVVGIFNQHAFYRDFLWHASIGYSGRTASLLIPCDAQAALDLFKFRDVPSGKTRRDALMHWVSQHWRRKPSNHEDAIKVHEHLRGQTSFDWANGLRVKILPASEDLKRIAEAKIAK